MMSEKPLLCFQATPGLFMVFPLVGESKPLSSLESLVIALIDAFTYSITNKS